MLLFLLLVLALVGALLEFYPGAAGGNRPRWWIARRTTLAPQPIRVRPRFGRRR